MREKDIRIEDLRVYAAQIDPKDLKTTVFVDRILQPAEKMAAIWKGVCKFIDFCLAVFLIWSCFWNALIGWSIALGGAAVMWWIYNSNAVLCRGTDRHHRLWVYFIPVLQRHSQEYI